MVEDGRFVAAGNVTAQRGADIVLADQVRILDGEIYFLEPTLSRDGVSVHAATATGTPDSLQLAQVQLNPCACCETAVWSLSARDAELRGDRVVWRRGWFEVAGRPLLPVPIGRLPLTPPRVVPGLPVLGRGPDGFQVALPLIFSPSEALALSLSPELRVERGPRLTAGVDYGGERARLELGASSAYDLQKDAMRGAVWGDAALAAGPLHGGVLGQWVGDEAWIADYGASLLDRQVPWTRQRGWVGAGPARLELLGWQLSPPATALVPSLVLSDAGRALGPMRADSVARLDRVNDGLRAEIGESTAIYATPGPLLVRVGADGRAWLSAADRGADGRADADALLQLWGQHGAVRHELGLGLRGGVGVGGGDSTPTSVADPLGLAQGGLRAAALPILPPLPAGGSVGPALVSSWTGPTTRVRFSIDAPWSPSLGPGLGATLQARHGPWRLQSSGAGAASGWFGAANLGLDGESLSLTLGYAGQRGAARVDQLRAQGAWRIAAAQGTWTPSAAMLARPDAVAGWELGLAWAASCGCASVGASVAFAEDREGPQIAGVVSLRPGGN